MCEDYNKEIQPWIANGWSELYGEAIHEKVTGFILLMATRQPNKPAKVRPVRDYRRELNKYINSHPGVKTAVYQDKLRKWRMLGSNACALDLKKLIYNCML